ncbi:hypothetical protein ACFFIO_07495 [Citricoccus parietis]|uniref:Transposase n=1 Tax=Citricoccus parietis TaxID=592307 RepID=A0ABV6F4J8_9MICC
MARRLEVLCPNRQVRRQRGKSDESDAYIAAEATLAGTADAVPKDGNGPIEAIRVVLVARANLQLPQTPGRGRGQCRAAAGVRR